MVVRYSTEFGLAGDGVTNDTTALNVALGALNPGDTLLMQPGGVYMIDPDTVKFRDHNDESWFGHDPDVIVGPCVIKARSAGTWLIASETWADDINSVNSPVDIHGVSFDGDGLVDYAVVSRAFSSRFHQCSFRGAKVDTLRFSATTKSGLYTANTSNCKVMDCRLDAETGQTGALLWTSTGDMWVIGNAFNGGAIVSYCLDVQNTAGSIFALNHTYGSTTADMYLRRVGKGGGVVDNTIEGGVLIGSAGDNRAARIGPGNTHWEDLTVLFDEDTDPEFITVVGDWFSTDPDGVEAGIVHSTSNANKRILSKSNTFRKASPYTEGYAGGIIDMGGNFAYDAVLPLLGRDLRLGTGSNLSIENGYALVERSGSAFLGRFSSDQPDPYLQFYSSGPSVGASFMQFRFGTLAMVYGSRRHIAEDLTGGSEDANIQEWLVRGGTLTRESLLGGGMTLGNPTGGVKGTGSLNADTGLYVDGVSALVSSGTKTTAAAPYTNDGYITVTLADGTTRKLLTTA